MTVTGVLPTSGSNRAPRSTAGRALGESTWLATMQHIAREGGCWVLSTATALQGSDVPANFPERDTLFKNDEWINPGDAVVVKPFGGVVAGPLHQEKGILYADIDPEAARNSRKSLDVTGHYGRPDLFHLEIDRRTMPPVAFVDDEVDA